MRPKANVGKKIGSGWSCLSNREHQDQGTGETKWQISCHLVWSQGEGGVRGSIIRLNNNNKNFLIVSSSHEWLQPRYNQYRWYRMSFKILQPHRNCTSYRIVGYTFWLPILHCKIGCDITIIPHIAPQRYKCDCSWVVSRGVTGLGIFLKKYCFLGLLLDRSHPLFYFVPQDSHIDSCPNVHFAKNRN